MTLPDLTKGDRIQKVATHDWNNPLSYPLRSLQRCPKALNPKGKFLAATPEQGAFKRLNAMVTEWEEKFGAVQVKWAPKSAITVGYFSHQELTIP